MIRRSGRLVLPAAAVLASTSAVPTAQAVDRTWIGGNTTWDGAFNKWTGNDEPDPDDRAIFNTNNTVDMAIPNNIAGLVMSGGIDLDTENFFLDVDGDISISGSSTLDVGFNNLSGGPAANLIDFHNLTINNNATFRLGGTRAEFADPGGANFGQIDINAGGTFFGNGTIDNDDIANPSTPFTILVNDGTLQVGDSSTGLIFIGGTPPARTLFIESSGGTDARVDLDGTSGNGVITINREATLDNNVLLSDAFGGTINMFQNSTLDGVGMTFDGGSIIVDNGAIAGSISPIFIPSVAAAPSTIRGGIKTQTGGVIDIVDSDGELIFEAGFNGEGGTMDLTSNGTVRFAAVTSTLSSGYNLNLGSNAQVIVDGATVTADEQNVDGTSGSDWTMRDGGRANWRGTLDGTNNNYDGTIRFEGIGSNVLDINVDSNDATINGIVVANGSNGTLFSSGNDNLGIQAQASVGTNGTLILDSNVIRFESGGSLAGQGRVLFREPVFIPEGETTNFSVRTLRIDDSNGQLTVGGGATLNISSDIIEEVNNTVFLINGGTANVSTDYSFGSGGDLRLISSGAGAVNPIYTGTGIVTFLNDSTLTVFDDAASYSANAVFQEGSEIELAANNARLTLGGSGRTIELAGGDFIDGGTDTRVATAGGTTLLVTGLSSANVDVFDFDQGTVRLQSGGTLDLNVGGIETGTDQYDSTTIFNGGTLDVNITAGNNTWIMDGTLRSDNGGTLRGDTVLIGDDVSSSDANVDVNVGVLSIAAQTIYNADADVDVATGSTLRHTNTVTFTPRNGAEDAVFEGTGTLQLAGTNNFNEVTTLNMAGGTVDLDNSNIISFVAFDTNINATTTINAATFAAYGSTKNFGGSTSFSEINIADTARLTVNIDDDSAWRVLSNGIINYAGNGTQSSFLAGDRLDLDGTLNVTGDGQILNTITVGGTVNILTSGEFLELEAGDNRIDGGTINGPGTLRSGTNDDLTGFGTVNADMDFNGSAANIVSDGGTLDLNGSILDIGTLVVSAGSTMRVDSDFNTNVSAGGININGGTLTGTGFITLENQDITGSGTVTATLVNNDEIIANGGVLVINRSNTNLDGNSPDGTGTLRANSAAVLELRNWATETFNGRIVASGAGRVFTNGKNLAFGGDSTMELISGGFRTNVNTAHAGELNASGNSNLVTLGSSVFSFGATSDVDTSGTLLLDGNFRVFNGATITGSGSLRLGPGELVINDDATISTLLNNDEGTVELGAGASVAQVNVQDYQQSDDGTLAIDISGTGLNQFDRLSLAGSGILDGVLDVTLLLAESVGQTFSIITGLNLSGAFDTVNVTGLDSGLALDVTYNPTSVVLEIVNAVSLPGDFNGNGSVEQADLDLVLGNWGSNTPPIPAGWVNDLPAGAVDQAELDKVLSNWGSTSAPSFAGSAVPEPGAAAVLLAMGGLALRRRRVA